MALIQVEPSKENAMKTLDTWINVVEVIVLNPFTSRK
jgi:hypothetical protein